MDLILDQSPDQLRGWMLAHDQRPYRASQIRKWLFAKRAAAWDEMTDLPRELPRNLRRSSTSGRPRSPSIARTTTARKNCFSTCSPLPLGEGLGVRATQPERGAGSRERGVTPGEGPGVRARCSPLPPGEGLGVRATQPGLGAGSRERGVTPGEEPGVRALCSPLPLGEGLGVRATQPERGAGSRERGVTPGEGPGVRAVPKSNASSSATTRAIAAYASARRSAAR